MSRERSYHDLPPEEKSRYDKLRAEQGRLRYGVAKPYDKGAYQKKKEEADAMLGLRPQEDTRIEAVRDPNYKVWRGSATHQRPRRDQS